jgi:hypothetical protein
MRIFNGSVEGRIDAFKGTSQVTNFSQSYNPSCAAHNAYIKRIEISD